MQGDFGHLMSYSYIKERDNLMLLNLSGLKPKNFGN